MANTDEIVRRAEAWADARETRLAGRNPWSVGVGTIRASLRDRVTGLAAEMAFFALLSLVPAVVALGASLGWLELVIGPEPVAQGREAVLTALAAVFNPQVTDEVMRPLVEGLLEEQRGGIAVSSLLVAFFLASRVFTATIRALDLAYNVEDRRNLLQQRILALVFAIGAVVLVPVVLVFVVVGPLLGGARGIAVRFGFGELFAALWALGRWPLLLVVAVLGFAAVYRFGPHVDNRWRDCLPGALLGVLLWLLASGGLRVYLRVAGEPTARFGAGEEAAALLAVVGALVAVLLWMFLSSVALLVGGELNAELAAARPARRPTRRAARGSRRLRSRSARRPPRGATTERLDG
jgi:membrane protein